MFRNQFVILPVITVLAFTSSARAEVTIRINADGTSEVQTSNVQVRPGSVVIRRNTRIRKKTRSGYRTPVVPPVYYPVVNPDRDYDADYGQTTIRSSSSSTVNGRTHRSTQTTTVRDNGRTVTQSSTTD